MYLFIYFMDEGVKVRMQEPNFNSSTPPSSQEQEPEQKTEQERAQARLLDKWRATRHTRPATARTALQSWADMWREERASKRR
jgi:hypothetical protein